MSEVLVVEQTVDDIADIRTVLIRFVIGKDPLLFIVSSFDLVVARLEQQFHKLVDTQLGEDDIFDDLLIQFSHFELTS